ncbi:ribose-phosphate pyrophosphokinase 4-like isoform X2 [Anneissia japonica]|uniref:ribose-phosphate pyrophosphokinase 4-like isoform X2 n=1 Tax=Anneissia japonica TaxID=1529436 RepID=UPI001425B981|nr:ribose-phosphate pyrophosphokinase 4-like isoform X2 [Anneissia japonica]
MAAVSEFSSRSALLFCHPSMESLAQAIEQTCDTESTKAALTPRDANLPIKTEVSPQSKKCFQTVEFRKTIQWESFNDGWPNLFIENVKECAGRDVIFLGSFHSPEVIFEQVSMLYTMPRYLARSFKFILPYFPTGTMERVDTEGQVVTAKTLAMLLSLIPSTARGPAQIVMYDIHCLQERFYFSDNIIPRLETAIPLLHREMSRLANEFDFKICIAFPDEGACKRFQLLFSDFPLITCTKIRNGDKRIVQVKEGDPGGKHVIIVDDLVQTGGTLKNCAEALLNKGAKTVSAFVTHAVFPKDSWKSFTTSKSKVPFKYFWITDSIPHAVEIAKHAPFKLLSLCDSISHCLLGFDLLQS